MTKHERKSLIFFRRCMKSICKYLPISRPFLPRTFYFFAIRVFISLFLILFPFLVFTFVFVCCIKIWFIITMMKCDILNVYLFLFHERYKNILQQFKIEDVVKCSRLNEIELKTIRGNISKFDLILLLMLKEKLLVALFISKILWPYYQPRV